MPRWAFIRIPLREIGLIMGFGAGVLISAVALDLIDEAAEKSLGERMARGGDLHWLPGLLHRQPPDRPLRGR
jgi:hypothetical protein